MKLSREFKIAIVAITTIALFIWSYGFMKGKNILKGPTPTYFTKFSNTEGLNAASKVTLKGVPIGTVESTKLVTEDGVLLVLVEFTVTQEGITFPKNSVVRLNSALMGGKSLAIVPGEGALAESGDYLQGEIIADMFSAVGNKLDPLSAKLSNILIASDSLLLGLNDVLDTKTKQNIKASIAKFNRTMTDFQGITANLNEMLEKNKLVLEETLLSAKETTDNVKLLTNKLNSELDEAKLAETVQELNRTISGINQVLAGLEKGEGTMGKLLKDEAMYTNLTNASKELEELLKEMKEHPKRFVHFSVFGKKDKSGYVEPEE